MAAVCPPGWVRAWPLCDFRQLPPSHQVAVVASDLQEHFWHEGARVVAVSCGGYLFLQAQAELPPFPGKVLLLSPIVGAVNTLPPID